jgi:hypothetical protein
MNALVSQDSLNIGTENAFHSYVVSILINTFLILIVLDYIVYRVQTINLFEKRIAENHERAFSKFKEETKNYEKSLEEYKVSNSKLLDGLCRGIDEKLLDINFQVQDGIDAVEKKLKLLVNSELDKVDNIYDKLTRKFLLLQSNISECCENNSDRMTNLEETLNAHISLLCDKIVTVDQYVEDIKKNVFKVDQKYYELKKMISRELDEMKQEYLTLYDEKMNEWSGSQLDSKICDLYCCVRSALEGNSIEGAFRKILEVNFPHIKFNEIPNDVCVRNMRLVNPAHPTLAGY